MEFEDTYAAFPALAHFTFACIAELDDTLARGDSGGSTTTHLTAPKNRIHLPQKAGTSTMAQ